jgi:zinc transport system permease protein
VSFWSAYSFWRDSMIAVVLAAAMCGYLGVYVVLRRVVFVGAALTQISGVGIASAFFLASFSTFASNGPHGGVPFLLEPQVFSLVFAVAGAVFFSFNRGGKRLASETTVGLGWVIASAAVLLILSSKRIAEEAHEVDDLLYGSAVLVAPGQVMVLAAVVASVLVVHLLFFKELLFVTYDSEMAQTLGYRTVFWDILLFVTFGVGISFAVRTVGALPAFAFLVVPAASAQLLVRRAAIMFPLAVAFAVLGGALGYYLSFTHQFPTGAAIVAASAVFLLPGAVRQLLRRGT